jgi:hypothetical protein
VAHCRDGGRPSWRPVIEVLRENRLSMVEAAISSITRRRGDWVRWRPVAAASARATAVTIEIGGAMVRGTWCRPRLAAGRVAGRERQRHDRSSGSQRESTCPRRGRLGVRVLSTLFRFFRLRVAFQDAATSNNATTIDDLFDRALPRGLNGHFSFRGCGA